MPLGFVTCVSIEVMILPLVVLALSSARTRAWLLGSGAGPRNREIAFFQVFSGFWVLWHALCIMPCNVYARNLPFVPWPSSQIDCRARPAGWREDPRPDHVDLGAVCRPTAGRHAGAAGGLFGIVEAVRQLRGGLGARQVQGAEIALVHNEGTSCPRIAR